MVDAAQSYLWAWDARPFPAFPSSRNVWSDGDSWYTGHWLNGRMGGAPIDGLIKQVFADFEFAAPDVDVSNITLDGFVIDRRMSVRAALESLCDAFGVAFTTKGDTISFMQSQRKAVATVEQPELVEEEDEPLLVKQLDAWEAEISSVTFGFKELFQDYRQSVARYDQPAGMASQDSSLSLAVISSQSVVAEFARNWLRGKNYGRQTVRFSLPPSAIAIEPGDLVTVKTQTHKGNYRIEEIEDGRFRQMIATMVPPRNSAPVTSVARLGRSIVPANMIPLFESLDLPLLPGKQGWPHAPYVASYGNPWKDGITIHTGSSESGFRFLQSLQVPAIIGELASPLAARHAFVRDDDASFDVKLLSGDLASVEQLAFLSGANAAAVKASNGDWEVLQFQNVELIGAGLWRLSGLLRGQLGTERAALSGVKTGARFVLLDEAVVPLQHEASQLLKELPHRLVPTGAVMGDVSNIDTMISFPGKGLQPLSPVHLRVFRQEETHDLEFLWIRRGRVDADSWVPASIPMDEDVEEYQISITTPNDIVVRSGVSSQCNWTYSRVDQIADGIDALNAIKIEVAQVSRLVGAGAPLIANITLDSLIVSQTI